MEDAAIIAVRGLARSFGSTRAVDGLDLDVHPGEILGLVGPDGAGKTTALRLFAGLARPTTGEVKVLGHDAVRHAGRVRASLGYMAQRFTLYPDLTVHENLLFFADVHGVRGQLRARRIARLLSFARLAEFGRRPAGQLSGGMQKKLALACALIHEPQVLLLDEPTTGVDPVSRREFWDMLGELHAQGVTMVISTPYMDEAERCSRVGLMYRGKLLACDAPARIKSDLQRELLAIWPADVRRARQALQALPWVSEVQPYGDQVRILVEDAQEALPRVAAALEAAGVRYREIQPAPLRMEEAFVSLIRRQHVESSGEPPS